MENQAIIGDGRLGSSAGNGFPRFPATETRLVVEAISINAWRHTSRWAFAKRIRLRWGVETIIMQWSSAQCRRRMVSVAPDGVVNKSDVFPHSSSDMPRRRPDETKRSVSSAYLPGWLPQGLPHKAIGTAPIVGQRARRRHRALATW